MHAGAYRAVHCPGMHRAFWFTLPLSVVASGALAQRPDLSGTWIAIPSLVPASLPAAPSPIMGARISLRIDGSSVALGRPLRDTSVVSVLPTDGTRVSSRIPGRLCEGERIFHETAAWEGDALVLTTVGTTPAGGGPILESHNRSILRLEAPDRLIIEGTMVQAGQRKQVGTVYGRTAESLPPPRSPLPVLGIPANIGQVAWIGGTWVGTAGPISTEERWTTPASGGMMATARTLRGSVLGSFEFLCIAERDGSLAYIALPDGRTIPTVFMLTGFTSTSATFENPANDYPKLIRYSQTLEGGLETTISGANGERSRSVVLKKQ